MIHSLESFQYKGTPIQVLGDYANPKFIAKEICNALNISNHRDALTRLDEDEKGVVISDTLGGKQEILVINEPGLYSLVLRSTKPEAKAFKRWITHEVLPSIRKQGFYGVPMAIKERVKIEMAKDRLEKYILRSSIWNTETVKRFMEVQKHLSNAELEKLFECSTYSINRLKMLIRHASGDFTDLTPKPFKIQTNKQLPLVQNLGKVSASEAVQRSIWKMKVIDERTYHEISDATGYSISACRNFVERQQLNMEVTHG
ncbi:MAG: BRO family protein [Balneola sp.]